MKQVRVAEVPKAHGEPPAIVLVHEDDTGIARGDAKRRPWSALVECVLLHLDANHEARTLVLACGIANRYPCILPIDAPAQRGSSRCDLVDIE